jgi:hypothetical protein
MKVMSGWLKRSASTSSSGAGVSHSPPQASRGVGLDKRIGHPLALELTRAARIQDVA